VTLAPEDHSGYFVGAGRGRPGRGSGFWVRPSCSRFSTAKCWSAKAADLREMGDAEDLLAAA